MLDVGPAIGWYRDPAGPTPVRFAVMQLRTGLGVAEMFTAALLVLDLRRLAAPVMVAALFVALGGTLAECSSRSR